MKIINAVLYSNVKPTETQEAKILEFLEKRYGDVTLSFILDTNIRAGFILEVGSDIYDWTTRGRLEQLVNEINEIDKNQNIIPIIKATVDNFKPKSVPRQMGSVVSVIDGVVTIKGLEQVKYGEIVMFYSGVKGMIMGINEYSSQAILFGSNEDVSEGMAVYRTNKTAGIGASDNYLGRVVDSLGNPIDGLGDISASTYLPIEQNAPTIIDRMPVNRPLETGILTIDAMFPIGKGQRELIIGDRQTGKTSIAIDTILNQKGKDVVCIYVAIGQKASSVARLVETLRQKDALEYSVIVASFASDESSLQYIAPYSATALAEYFMHNGKDVLIVYDDLSKHAIAYRTISLLLGRAPGREAYPGDVFYLHSRLLERSAQLSLELGGGSITALPIVETQSSDVSAYIPTNIISITDGQIFLESDLFFSGQRPAINIGLSVSRVGGDAQTKAIKKATGTLRLDLAQYREIEVFTQFASDLDEATKEELVYGACLMQVLRQGLHKPLKQYEEVIILVIALAHLFVKVPLNKISDVKDKVLKYFNDEQNYICHALEENKVLTLEIKDDIINNAKTFISNYLGE